MSWEKKSEDSLCISNKLIQDSFFNVSVHCSYYSCLQFMFHVVSEFLNMTEKEIKIEIDRKSSHAWLINLVTLHLGNLESKSEARAFNMRMIALKRSREEADYSQKYFSTDVASSLLQEATELKIQLNKVFL